MLGLLAPLNAFGAVYSYVDWTEADVPGGKASGTITLSDASKVTVTFAAINKDGSPGSLYAAQTTGGSNYWSPDVPYISTEVENAPPTPDILQLSGGQDQTYKVTLSEAIKDPIMAIVSLGQSSLRTTYDFDSPFTIVSQGPGYWGGTNTSLKALVATSSRVLRDTARFASLARSPPSRGRCRRRSNGTASLSPLEPPSGSSPELQAPVEPVLVVRAQQAPQANQVLAALAESQERTQAVPEYRAAEAAQEQPAEMSIAMKV